MSHPSQFDRSRFDLSRRQLLKSAALSLPLMGMPGASGLLRANDTPAVPLGKAEHCIFVWLGGGMAQVDTFDPKGQGDAKAKKPGSYYPLIDTSVKGVQFTQPLPKLALQAEKLTAVRSTFHGVINEHAAATNWVHTGRPTSGSVVYPSIGSIISHERGAVIPGMPSYILMGYPNISRGPGFLGAKGSFVYLTDTKAGPTGFTRPYGVTAERKTRREELLNSLHNKDQSAPVADYDATLQESMRLSAPEFMQSFNLDAESAELRNSYGGEFGQRCLLARRLVERGARFIEVSHNLNFLNGTGWDTHNDGQLKQHLLIHDLDVAIATLITDLERVKLLDKTIIVIATEFGRPSDFDGGGGRNHQATSFTMVMAGGGLRHTGAYGVTDDLGKNIVENPVSVADFHATVHAAMGINPHKELYDGSRPVPITDRATPIKALLT
jgi:hypothetical protein